MTVSKGKTMIVLCGPTAVGKTAAALRLSEAFHCPVISADSRQCYRELRIGVARPSEAELAQAPHFFIATHSIQDELTAAGFADYALAQTRKLFELHDVLLMVGGTGLYIRAFCEGLDEIPEIEAGVRDKIISQYEQHGLVWLQEQVKKMDPDFYAGGEIQNPQRLMRALEVVESTGQSILDFRKGKKIQHDFQIIRIGLELPREVLVNRIDARVDAMMLEGLVEEVRSLHSFRSLNALQTVGYTELFDYLEGKDNLGSAVEKIKIHTRQYAKRQMTWFRRDPAIHWFAPDDIKGILSLVNREIAACNS